MKAQQTFLSVLENLDDFRGEASFSTWLLRIATHAAIKANVNVRLLRARLHLREHLTRTLGDPQTRIERGHQQHE